MNIWQKIGFLAGIAQNKKSPTRGAQAEQYALDYLLRQGLRLVDRNVHYKRGEIDLIMAEHATLIFVEVRLRTRGYYASAIESIGYQKQAKLIQAARHYLHQHYGDSEPACRFDVLALECAPKVCDKNKPLNSLDLAAENCSIEWIKNAFEANPLRYKDYTLRT